MAQVAGLTAPEGAPAEFFWFPAERFFLMYYSCFSSLMKSTMLYSKGYRINSTGSVHL
jgi:hypothetical protein